MGKIAFWILVAVAVMLVLRLIGTNEAASWTTSPRRSRARRFAAFAARQGDRDDRRDSGELMMSCAVCGIHVPASDAVFARGKVYCSADHRDAADRDGGLRDEPPTVARTPGPTDRRAPAAILRSRRRRSGSRCATCAMRG